MPELFGASYTRAGALPSAAAIGQFADRVTALAQS
jgi:hypothetical protein